MRPPKIVLRLWKIGEDEEGSGMFWTIEMVD